MGDFHSSYAQICFAFPPCTALPSCKIQKKRTASGIWLLQAKLRAESCLVLLGVLGIPWYLQNLVFESPDLLLGAFWS